MQYDKTELISHLTAIANELDIPPSKFKLARDRYNAVGNWLSEGQYPEPNIYVQGSFMLGTVVKPIVNGDEGEYDIDLVCQFSTEVSKNEYEPKTIKNAIGDRLKSHETYKNMLDREGKRCWTLNYADKDIGFHLDILPSTCEEQAIIDMLISHAVPVEKAAKAIAITDKDKANNTYQWFSSNPKGYKDWFYEQASKMPSYYEASNMQKTAIFNNNRTIFASVDDVPQELVKSPLQRAIQLLKRSRDIYFSESPEFKPISMIITTLAAQAYNSEDNILDAFVNIVCRLSRANANDLKLIYRDITGWHIPNPVNPLENFADKWTDDHAREFFKWIDFLNANITLSHNAKNDIDLAKYSKIMFGETVINRVYSAQTDAFTTNRLAGKLATASSGIISTQTKGKIKNREHNFHYVKGK